MGYSKTIEDKCFNISDEIVAAADVEEQGGLGVWVTNKSFEIVTAIHPKGFLRFYWEIDNPTGLIESKLFRNSTELSSHDVDSSAGWTPYTHDQQFTDLKIGDVFYFKTNTHTVDGYIRYCRILGYESCILASEL